MKNVFSYNVDVDKNAYLNWRTEKRNGMKNMIVLADGFMKSALLLANDILEDNIDKKADIIIFSMLFNVNHAIELYLKVICWELNYLLDKDQKFDKHHNIKQIFSVVMSRMREYEEKKERRNSFKELTKGLKLYLSELYELIENSTSAKMRDNIDFSRYPFSNDFDNHFYIDKVENVVVDIENFNKRFSEIGNNLESIAKHYLYEHIFVD